MSAQMYVPQVLTDLYGRAGASDQDRAAWLLERLGGITATEVRDLHLGKLKTQDLIDLKLGRRVDTFAGNRYTDWGKAREPVIAEVMRGEGFDPESRVFHHADDSRYLASPDGIQVTWDEALCLLEIKTCGHDLPPGSLELARKGYVAQMVWQMFVMGAARCRLVVEVRRQLPDGSFAPGELHRHWIEMDLALLVDLVKLADQFLAELDRQREDGAPVVDEDVDTHAVNYLRALDEVKRWTTLKDDSYRAVVAAGVSHESDMARVTFMPGKPGEVVEVVDVDQEAAQEARGDLWAKVSGARQKAAAAEKQWAAHLLSFTTTTEVVGRGKPAGARITAGKGTRS